jgi:hypothetical protein
MNPETYPVLDWLILKSRSTAVGRPTQHNDKGLHVAETTWAKAIHLTKPFQTNLGAQEQ